MVATFLRSTWLMAAIGLLAGCAWHGSGVEGHVFEMGTDTRLPSADAYVVVYWTATAPGIVHFSTMCLHATIGKTDERGHFEVPAWWSAPKIRPVFPHAPEVMVYKPGFDRQADSRNTGDPMVHALVRSKLTAEERVAVLSLIAEAGCFDRQAYKPIPLEDPQGVAEHFYRALYEEAQALGPLPRTSDGYLVTLREKAGVPPPPEPPRQIRAIQPQGPRPAAPR
jgi:hypothetical protein